MMIIKGVRVVLFSVAILLFAGCRPVTSGLALSIADSGEVLVDGRPVEQATLATMLVSSYEKTQSQFIPSLAFGCNADWSAVAKVLGTCFHYGARKVMLLNTNSHAQVLFFARYYESPRNVVASNDEYASLLIDGVFLTGRGIERTATVMRNEEVAGFVNMRLQQNAVPKRPLFIIVTSEMKINDLMVVLIACEPFEAKGVRIVDEMTYRDVTGNRGNVRGQTPPKR